MSTQAQIDADAALARRLQNEEFAAQPHFQAPRSSPRRVPAPFAGENSPLVTGQAVVELLRRARQTLPVQTYIPSPQAPFARGSENFDTGDMMAELLRCAGQGTPSMRRAVEALSEVRGMPSFSTRGRRPGEGRGGREGRRGGGSESFPSLFQETFGGSGLRAASYVMSSDGLRPVDGARARGREGRGGPAMGGTIEIGGPAGEMLNMVFSGMLPLGQQGDGGGSLADIMRGLFPGGMPEEADSYEDMLAIIERMGGDVNRSATDEEIASIETHKFDKKTVEQTRQRRRQGEASSSATDAAGEEVDKCAICLGEYEDGEEVKMLPCNHMFHSACVDHWLRVNRTCPFCKQSIREGESSEL